MRGYYSGAYSSSTNAYMLMYRQIDKERNSEAITVDEFPPHIKVSNFFCFFFYCDWWDYHVFNFV